MSEENAGRIRRAYEVWNESGPAAVTEEFWSEDAVYREGPGWPDAGVYQGRAAALERMQSLIDLLGPIAVHLDELIDVGDGRFVACTRIVGESEADAPYTRSFAVVHRLRDGLIVEADYYLDRAQALEATGLRDQAMSQENVEVVRKAYEAFNRGDLDVFADLFAPDATVHPVDYWPDDMIRQGRGEIISLFREVREPWDRPESRAAKLIDRGDYVVAEHVYRGAMKGTTDEVEWRLGMSLTFRDGTITDMSFFRTFDQALEAVGLSEQAISQQNIETFKRCTDAYNRRDVEALLKELDPEVEWRSAILMPLGREARVHQGHTGVREGLRNVYEALAEVHVEYSEIRDLSDRIVGIGRVRMRERESGVKTESPLISVTDVKNGKGIRVWNYLDREQALKAAGLSG